MNLQRVMDLEMGIGKIVLAFDSFKGSATAAEVGDAAARGIRAVFTECEVVKIPVADGGEGSVEAICRNFKSEQVTCHVHDPLMRPVEATYSILDDTNTAVIELAAASGLTLLEQALRDPLVTTTFGTGELIADALDRGCRNFIIGLGGSATNDAAMGLLAALGFKFLDASGKALEPVGGNLARVASIDTSHADNRLTDCVFTVACDVENPMYGPNGAAAVYAPQKGADDATVNRLDAGSRNIATIFNSMSGKEIALIPGSGAAGGAGGGIAALLNATLERGHKIILDLAQFDNAIMDADLIITGEGRIDSQTSMGKAISGIAERARVACVPVIAIAGAVELDAAPLDDNGLAAVFSIQQKPVTAQQAMDNATTLRNVEITVRNIMKTFKAIGR